MKNFYFIVLLFGTYFTSQAQNYALVFDGNNYLEIGNSGPNSPLSIGTNDFTIEAYVSTDSLANSNNNTEHTFIGCESIKASGEKLGWALRTGGSGKLEFVFGNGIGSSSQWKSLVSPNVLFVNQSQFYHVAIVRNGLNYYMYVNGAVVASGLFLSPDINQAAQAITVGDGGSGNSRLYGTVDEIKMWNIARTTSEIIIDKGYQCLTKQAGINGHLPNLLFYINNENNNNAYAPNEVGNLHHGYFNGVCNNRAMGNISTAQSTIYVNAASTGSNRLGTSWADAFPNLQAALDVATCANVQDIWIAEGKYVPSKRQIISLAKTETFEIPQNINLYGGFAGTETNKNQRNVAAHITYLSGDIAGDDNWPTTLLPYYLFSQSNTSDNIYTIVTAAYPSFSGSQNTFDGLTIIGGYANNDLAYRMIGGSNLDYKYGGGMLLFNGTTTINNCKLLFNYAHLGAGIHASTNNVYLTNSMIYANRGTEIGSAVTAISNFNQVLDVSNCQFINNFSYQGAGAITTTYNKIKIDRSVFVRNRGDDQSGAVDIFNADTSLVTNSLFAYNLVDNSDEFSAGAIKMLSTYGEFINNTLTKNINSDKGPGGLYASVINLKARNNIFYKNFNSYSLAPFYHSWYSDFRLGSSSSAQFSYNILQYPDTAYTNTTNGIHHLGNVYSPNYFNANPQFLKVDTNFTFTIQLYDVTGPDSLYQTADDYLQLSPTSPYLDSGAFWQPINAKDILGNPRYSNGKISIGAYENYGCLAQHYPMQGFRCKGFAYNYLGTPISASGITQFTYINQYGCDSIIDLEVLEFPKKDTNLIINICVSDSFLFNGVYLTQAGSYSDTVADVNGCDSITNINLIINNNPTVTVSTNIYTICPNQQATLTGNGANTYTFLGNNINGNIASPTITTVYTIVGTDTNGCTGTDSVTINVLPAPTMIVNNPYQSCTGNTLIITANTDYGYIGTTWFDAPNGNVITTANSIFYNGNTDTVFYAQSIDFNYGCGTGIVPFIIKVQNTPSAPTVYPTSVICGDSGIANLQADSTNCNFINWYDSANNLLHTGKNYSPTISATQTFYASAIGKPDSVQIPAQTSTVNISGGRGYYFVAPKDFTITSLYIPTTASTANQNIAVVKFNNISAIPPFNNATNSFTTLYHTQNNSSAGKIAVCIPIKAGDSIGIIGGRGTMHSYSNLPTNSQRTIYIDSMPVVINKLGTNVQISSGPITNLWSDGLPNIGRINFEYITNSGCESAKTPVTIQVINPKLNILTSANACPYQPTTLHATADSGFTIYWTNNTVFPNTTLNNNSTTLPYFGSTFYVFAQNNNCTAKDSISFTALPAPTVFGSPSLSTCAGDTIQLVANSNLGNIKTNWFDVYGNFLGSYLSYPFAGNTTTIINFTVEDTTNGCISSVDQQIVYVQPKPNLQLLASSSAICFGDTLQINNIAPVIFVDTINANPSIAATACSAMINNNSTNNADVYTSITFNNTTIFDTDYINVKDLTINTSFTSVYTDSTYAITLIGAPNKYYKVSIDFQNDGVFSGADLIYAANSASGIFSIPIYIPDSAAINDVRLRILVGDNSNPNPCAGISFFPFQQVDYKITIKGKKPIDVLWSAPMGFVEANANQINYLGSLQAGNYIASASITGVNGCVAKDSVPFVVNALPMLTVNSYSVAVCENTSFTLNGTGADSLAWSGGILNNQAFAVTASDTYTLTGIDVTGCSNSLASVVIANATSTNLSLSNANNQMSITGTDSTIQFQVDGASLNYTDANCNIIASVNDGAGGNILGNTTAQVTVEDSSIVVNNIVYSKRWYQITPTNNGAANITLFFTQHDFDDFNADPLSLLDLPINDLDSNINNIRVYKIDGTLGIDPPTIITPTTTWNAINNYWSCTFGVSGFSKFYLGTSSATPLNIGIVLSGKNINNTNQLTWNSIDNVKNYEVQKWNGNEFVAIATTENANYVDEIIKVENRYRVKVNLINGNSVVSNVVKLNGNKNLQAITTYPNPTSDIINIFIANTKPMHATIKLLDATGKLVKQIETLFDDNNTINTLDISDLANGIYLLKIDGEYGLHYQEMVKKQ
jgi:hypothetical protein